MRGTKIRWHEKSYATFRHRIRQLTGRSWGVSMEYRYHKLAQYIRGWMGYYGISEYYRPIPTSLPTSRLLHSLGGLNRERKIAPPL